MLSSLYILLTLLWGFCYGFVLLSSPAGAGGVPERFFPTGNAWNYAFRSSVLQKEKGGSDEKSVGFFIDGELLVKSVWGVDSQRLLEIQLVNPRLHIRSRKSPDSKGFSVHHSNLDGIKAKPFFVAWNKGKIDKILLPKKETLGNLKKGIAGLFQFQFAVEETNESDASGVCLVKYKKSDQHFIKTKKDCTSSELPFIRNPQPLFQTIVESSRTSHYNLDDSDTYFLKVSSKESHVLYTAAQDNVGAELEAEQSLKLGQAQECTIISAATLQQAIDLIEGDYTEETLLTEPEVDTHEDQKQFANAVANFRELLQPKSLGSLQSAKAFVHLVRVARRSSKEDISKALGSKKNHAILHQVYDTLGFVQTLESHEAAMKKLHFEKSNHEELSERYLWALAVCANPNPDVIQDLLQKYRKLVNIPKKVKETMVLAIASMAKRLGHQTKTHRVVEEAIANELTTAKNDERIVLLRALKNLQSPSTIDLLLAIVKKGTLKEVVYAWRAILAQDPVYFNEEVYRAAYRTFYQLDKKYDSSARTLAVDVLLEANPSEETLRNLLGHLKSKDKAFEVKQYLLQRIRMLAEQNEEFNRKVRAIIINDVTLNNYHILGQRGLSTALSRSFLKGSSINGSLITIQEMNGGIVKRGVVNVVLSKERVSQEIFSLGIFSGGLGSFLSSSDPDNDGEDETATAGMDLTVLGNQIRPFTFFSGQGELMGHVWSGTASERTTAFQALLLLQDHHQFLQLANGFIVEMDVKGAASFDLAGSVQLSLWNRNGQALVEKAAGILLSGLVKVDTSFVKTFVDFNASLEPKLQLNADIDFSSDVMLCLRLNQPDALFRHNVHLVERVLDGSKHKFRIAKYRKSTIPGKTYALNKKNNNMCSAIFR